MVRLQRVCAARPGEVCQMRGCDIDTGGDVWIYRPATHKTAHHGHSRTIPLGPKAQEIIGPHLKPNPTAYLFSPAESAADRRAVRQANRKTPARRGNVPGSNRKAKPERCPGQRFTVASYRRAIERACETAFPPPGKLPRAWKLIRRWRRTRKGRSMPRVLTAAAEQIGKWREDHRWHPHQIRHTRATELRKEFGIQAVQVILGQRSLPVAEVYAEPDAETARRIMGQVG